MVGVVGLHLSSLRFRNVLTRQYCGTNLIVIGFNCNRQHNTNKIVGFPSNRPQRFRTKNCRKKAIVEETFHGKKHNRVTLKYFREVDPELCSTDRWCTTCLENVGRHSKPNVQLNLDSSLRSLFSGGTTEDPDHHRSTQPSARYGRSRPPLFRSVRLRHNNESKLQCMYDARENLSNRILNLN
jgi:hypothetical protein